MVALDLLGRRASLRILWELRDEPLTFRALQDAAGTNPSILNTRLRELREAHLVERGDSGYQLTPAGKTLLVAIAPLYAWAEKWGGSGSQ